MRMTTRRLRQVLGGFLVTAGVATGTVLLGTTPAFADATGCTNNVCEYLAGNPGAALVQGWARTNTFYGHFHLSGPGLNNGNGVDSPTQNWYGKKGNYWSYNVNGAAAGQYCIAGYASNGAYQGTACETLS